MTRVRDWCPTCRERTSLPETGRCPWCDTPLESKRGGWKRPDLASRITDQQLRALHVAYWQHGVSINQLAQRVYAKLGYKTAHTCAVAISNGWKRLELPARDRIEATRLASTRHGHAPKRRTPAQERAYRQWRKDKLGWNSLQGPGRPRCQGVKRQPPGAGSPCQRPAAAGSNYCVAHDPAKADCRREVIAAMNAARDTPEMLPMAPFSDWLTAKASELGSLRKLHQRLGGNYTALSRYAKGQGTDGKPKAWIARQTIERYLADTDVSINDIYSPAHEENAA